MWNEILFKYKLSKIFNNFNYLFGKFHNTSNSISFLWYLLEKLVGDDKQSTLSCPKTSLKKQKLFTEKNCFFWVEKTSDTLEGVVEVLILKKFASLDQTMRCSKNPLQQDKDKLYRVTAAKSQVCTKITGYLRQKCFSIILVDIVLGVALPSVA